MMKKTVELLLIMTSAVLTKGVGSAYRIHDDRKAPKHVRDTTIKREATTLLQLGVYSAVTKVLLLDTLKASLADARDPLLKKMSQVLESKNGMLGAVTALAVLSNAMAESISRKFAPRDVIWEKGFNKCPISHDPQNAFSEGVASFPTAPPVLALNIVSPQGTPVPVSQISGQGVFDARASTQKRQPYTSKQQSPFFRTVAL